MKTNILRILFLINILISPSYLSATTVAQDDGIEHDIGVENETEQKVTVEQINQVIGKMVQEAVSRVIEEQHANGQSLQQLQQLLLVVRDQGVKALNFDDKQDLVGGLTGMYRDVIAQQVDGQTLIDRSFHRIFRLFNFSVNLMQVALTIFVASVTWRLISAITGYTISGILFNASGLGLVTSLVLSIFGVTKEVVQESEFTPQHVPTGLWSKACALVHNGMWALQILSTIKWSISVAKHYGPGLLPNVILV